MKTQLIEAIKKTIDDLKFNKKYYHWAIPAACNCGILAQNILQISKTELSALMDNTGQCGWTKTSILCQETGQRINIIFEKLLSIGLTYQNIINLENLSDKNIEREMNICLFINEEISCFNKYFLSSFYRQSKEHLILYLEAWLRILEREQSKLIIEKILSDIENSNEIIREESVLV